MKPRSSESLLAAAMLAASPLVASELNAADPASREAYEMTRVAELRIIARSWDDALKKAGLDKVSRVHQQAAAEYNKRFNADTTGKSFLIPQWSSGYYSEWSKRLKQEGRPEVQTPPHAPMTDAPKPRLAARAPQTREPSLADDLAKPLSLKERATRIESARFAAYPKLWRLIADLNMRSPEGPLKHVCFVLDPGHGGMDPGASGQARHGIGFESAIVYDAAMRLMVELGKLGATVYLTHYSDTHGVREIDYPSRLPTQFEFGKGPVAKAAQVRSLSERRAMPRVVKGKPEAKGRSVVFISLHADSRETGERKNIGVYIDKPRDGHAAPSDRAFAEKLVTALGGAAFIHEQGLFVLRGNEADERVLIELGNVQSKDELPALLGDKKGRQKLANRIAFALSRALSR